MYILEGEVHSRFLCLVELPGGTASDTMLKVFAARSISLEKLCGIATDAWCKYYGWLPNRGYHPTEAEKPLPSFRSLHSWL